MSETTMTRCDGCGKRVEDSYDEAGWLHIASALGLRVSLHLGRGKNQQAKTIFHDCGNELDFCRIECFKDWVWKKRR